FGVGAWGDDTETFQDCAEQRDHEITFVGRICFDKGVHALLTAFPLVRQRHPTVRLALVGAGPHEDALKAAWRALAKGDRRGFIEECNRAARRDGVAESTLEPTARFLESVTDEYFEHAQRAADAVEWVGPLGRQAVAERLAHGAAAVLPSIVPEAHPLSVCEALATGTPVVGTGKAGIAQILGELERAAPELRGRLLADANPELFVRSLAERISDLLSRPPSDRAKSLSREIVQTNFAWANTARALTTGVAAATWEVQNA
ncbi:MAG: glycosyltransferase, partial [Myxococcota bacterium]